MQNDTPSQASPGATAGSPPIATLTIPWIGRDDLKLPLAPASVLFVVGQNGTGKSALMHHFKMGLGDAALYMPGSRAASFEAESLSMNPASRRALHENLKHWDRSPEVRWKLEAPTARNEKAIHDLQTVETSYTFAAASDIKKNGASSQGIRQLQSNSSPLDRINMLLGQANLAVRLVMSQAELRASRGNAIYSIARMSDGERTAMIFAAEVVAAEPGTVFVVDEPELHLHRSIIVPLLRSLIEMRRDCAFIVGTHELALPGEFPDASALLIRNCEWTGQRVSAWDVELIAKIEVLPEWLRVDVLGSRKKMLFIEGKGSRSLDPPMYALLFPEISVVNKGSCKEVHRAVVGVNSVAAHHHAQAFGVVDQDGMESNRAEDLATDGVYALPIYAIESLYYSGSVLAAVAAQQVSTLGGDASELLRVAKQQALASIKEHQLVHLAGHIAERQLRDQLQFVFPDRQAMIDAGSRRIVIDVESPYPVELARLKEFVAQGDLDAIIRRYPVRESGILNDLAKGLKFTGCKDYESAALVRIAASAELRRTLQGQLGDIATHL